MKKLKIIFCIVISTLMSANAIAFADENALFEPLTETTPSTEQPATDGENDRSRSKYGSRRIDSGSSTDNCTDGRYGQNGKACSFKHKCHR